MTEGEKLLCRMLELFLDEHPEKEIIVHQEIVEGEFRHKAEVKERNWKVK